MLIIIALGLEGSHLWLLVYCQLCTASVICKTVTCGCWRDLSRGCLLRCLTDKCCSMEWSSSFFCWRRHGALWIGTFRIKSGHRYTAVINSRQGPVWINTFRIKSGHRYTAMINHPLSLYEMVFWSLVMREGVTAEFTLLEFVGQYRWVISCRYGSGRDFSHPVLALSQHVSRRIFPSKAEIQ